MGCARSPQQSQNSFRYQVEDLQPRWPDLSSIPRAFDGTLLEGVRLGRSSLITSIGRRLRAESYNMMMLNSTPVKPNSSCRLSGPERRSFLGRHSNRDPRDALSILHTSSGAASILPHSEMIWIWLEGQPVIAAHSTPLSSTALAIAGRKSYNASLLVPGTT